MLTFAVKNQNLKIYFPFFFEFIFKNLNTFRRSFENSQICGHNSRGSCDGRFTNVSLSTDTPDGQLIAFGLPVRLKHKIIYKKYFKKKN